MDLKPFLGVSLKNLGNSLLNETIGKIELSGLGGAEAHTSLSQNLTVNKRLIFQTSVNTIAQ